MEYGNGSRINGIRFHDLIQFDSGAGRSDIEHSIVL